MAADASISGLVAGAWREALAFAAAFPAGDSRPIAIGWATVELERAARELTVALGLGGDPPFRAAPRSEALGASCLMATGLAPDGRSLLVLEPDTEGRLAGSLARFGEGPRAMWLLVSGRDARFLALAEAGLNIAPERAGPFGGERLLTDASDRMVGRHRLLVPRAAGTIHP